MNTNKLLRLKFSYAYTGKIIPASLAAEADTAWDKIAIYCSVDCGKSWTLKWSKSGINMETTNSLETEFVPSDTSQWRTDSVNIHGYVTSGATNLRIKIEFTSGGGNNFYFDNYIMDNHTVSAEEYFRDLLEMKVFPNPSSENSTLSLNLPSNENIKINITDMLGRNILNVADGEFANGLQTFEIPAAEMNKGVYFINVMCGEYLQTIKYVVE